MSEVSMLAFIFFFVYFLGVITGAALLIAAKHVTVPSFSSHRKVLPAVNKTEEMEDMFDRRLARIPEVMDNYEGLGK